MNKHTPPYATKEQMQSEAVVAFIKKEMPEAQARGLYFHDAFRRCMQKWNNGASRDASGFMLPYEFGETKTHREKSGAIVRMEIAYHIKAVLGIKSTKMSDICEALGVFPSEIWPENLIGNNHVKERLSSDEAYTDFWHQGGRTLYKIIRTYFQLSPRDSIRLAIHEYNSAQGESEEHMLVQKGAQERLIRLFPLDFKKEGTGINNRPKKV